MSGKTTMCDNRSLTWCGRITLLFTFCAVLCTMMFQIWSYYFSLVTQMDTLVIESPHVGGILDYCGGNIVKSWNIEDCVQNTTMLSCKTYFNSDNIYLDVRGIGNVSLVNESIIVQPLEACVKVLYWILPW